MRERGSAGGNGSRSEGERGHSFRPGNHSKLHTVVSCSGSPGEEKNNRSKDEQSTFEKVPFTDERVQKFSKRVKEGRLTVRIAVTPSKLKRRRLANGDEDGRRLRHTRR